MTQSLAFSPCPNDTFLFFAWVHGLVGKIPTEVILADIQQLNLWAQEGKYAISKVSFGCLPALLKEYVLLPCGTAVGEGCGPKLVSKKPFPLETLSQKTVAIPGIHTTAYMLMQLLLPYPKHIVELPYYQITQAIREGKVDCGLVIHETRFCMEQEGVCEIVDLGDLWEQEYSLPIPLGGIVAKRNLGHEKLTAITKTLQASLNYAWNHPDQTFSYMQAHSQNKDKKIIRQHVDLYITEDTLSLSPRAMRGIEKLLNPWIDHENFSLCHAP